ncbi:hypothetical protein [Psychrobacillus sp. NPDC093180]|uniref:hypothetical protein n=1 Tax=Psychrobacillus sp. NPDC093180 TaxID=3364489 RepID=UPI003819C12B
MANWIPGPGYYIVQPVGPINKEGNERILEEVKRKLEEAEKLFAIELSYKFIIKTNDNRL